jgi:hypothetical protein
MNLPYGSGCAFQAERNCAGSHRIKMTADKDNEKSPWQKKNMETRFCARKGGAITVILDKGVGSFVK